MSAAHVVELEWCGSTQDEVQARLDDADPGTVVVVRAARQAQGRGRGGRTWTNPPGAALLMSVGVRGPLGTHVLEDLPRRACQALLDAIGALAPTAHAELEWRAPNDLVAREGGAKLAGVLVDSRTVGTSVEHVVIGIGCNVAGAAFALADERAVTTLESLAGGGPVPTVAQLARNVADRLTQLVRA